LLVCFTYVFLKVSSEQSIYFPSHKDKTQNGQEFDTGMFGFYQNRNAQIIHIQNCNFPFSVTAANHNFLTGAMVLLSRSSYSIM